MDSPTLLLLLVGVPPTPSSLRVRVWRRLRSLGAVPLKRSAYLLPDTPERYEDFQWLAQEIPGEGGGATLIRVQQIENLSHADVLRLFHEPRGQDYRPLAAPCARRLAGRPPKATARGGRLPGGPEGGRGRGGGGRGRRRGGGGASGSTPPAAPRPGASRTPSPCAPAAPNRPGPSRPRPWT